MRIVLLGAPGAGKGTQCKRIVEKYDLSHLSSGDILRSERAEGTELGKKAQNYMDKGELVPDDVIVEMMVKAVANLSGAGFVLDGFPRTVNQAEELDKSLEAAGQPIDAVVNLRVPDEEVKKRLTGRRSCPKCGSVYHIEMMPPREDNKCDKDGEQLIQRSDDTEQTVANRLETYHQQTEPVVGYYEQNNTVYNIEADKDVDKISSLIFEKLDALA